MRTCAFYGVCTTGTGFIDCPGQIPGRSIFPPMVFCADGQTTQTGE